MVADCCDRCLSVSKVEGSPSHRDGSFVRAGISSDQSFNIQTLPSCLGEREKTGLLGDQLVV